MRTLSSKPVKRARSLGVVVAIVLAVLPAVPAAASEHFGVPGDRADPVPIVVDASQFQGGCDLPDLIPGTDCGFWYGDGNAPVGDLNWGFANLDQWDVSQTAACVSGGGASARGGYILNNSSGHLTLATSGATYVCSLTGHATDNWQDLDDRMNSLGCRVAPCPGPTLILLVNDCAQQIDGSGDLVPCGTGTPDKFAIVGFTPMQMVAIYRGNDPAAIGSPGTPDQAGDCGNDGMALGAADTVDPALSAAQTGGWDLAAFADANCGALRPPDSIDAPVTVGPSIIGAPALVACISVPAAGAGGSPSPSGCDYYFNPDTNVLSWWDGSSQDVGNRVSFGWTVDGSAATPGACGVRASDPDAICLVMQWQGRLRELRVTKDGPRHGWVQRDPKGYVCHPDCTVSYVDGSKVRLTARPRPGAVFAGWSGACSGVKPCILRMDQLRKVTATFTKG